MRKSFWIVLALVVLGSAPRSSADTFTSDLNIGSDALSGFTGPFGTVTVDLTNSLNARVTFTSDIESGNIYLFGGAQAVDLNVNATSFSAGSFSESNAGTGFSPGPIIASGPGNVDGLGAFNLTIDNFDGFTHSADTFSFNLFNGLGTWSSASDVLTPNSKGNDAAAHIFVTSSPANAANGAIVTGFAGEGPTVPAPEPSSLALLLTGLVGFVGIRRRNSV